MPSRLPAAEQADENIVLVGHKAPAAGWTRTPLSHRVDCRAGTMNPGRNERRLAVKSALPSGCFAAAAALQDVIAQSQAVPEENRQRVRAAGSRSLARTSQAFERQPRGPVGLEVAEAEATASQRGRGRTRGHEAHNRRPPESATTERPRAARAHSGMSLQGCA
jgi:hypothetical protein